jgi:hypothetical protein
MTTTGAARRHAPAPGWCRGERARGGSRRRNLRCLAQAFSTTLRPAQFALTQVYLASNVLVVGNAVPAKTFQELVILAKAQPGTLTYASGGGGSSPHMTAELLKSVAGVDIRQIPYKGVISAIPDLLAGRVAMMFAPISSVLPSVREGRLRALAVTSLQRSSTLPDVPTIDESGIPGFEVIVGRLARAPRNARSDHPQAPSRNRQRARAARGARHVRSDRHGNNRQLVRRVCRSHQVRDPEMGEADQRVGHQGGLGLVLNYW